MPLVAAVPPAPTDLAWRVIGLVNLYRLLIPPALYLLFLYFGTSTPIGHAYPDLFLWTCVVYFATGMEHAAAGEHSGFTAIEETLARGSE